MGDRGSYQGQVPHRALCRTKAAFGAVCCRWRALLIGVWFRSRAAKICGFIALEFRHSGTVAESSRTMGRRGASTAVARLPGCCAGLSISVQCRLEHVAGSAASDTEQQNPAFDGHGGYCVRSLSTPARWYSTAAVHSLEWRSCWFFAAGRILLGLTAGL